jgi:hypothetical protein
VLGGTRCLLAWSQLDLVRVLRSRDNVQID